MLEFDMFEVEFTGETEDRSAPRFDRGSYRGPELALRLLTVAESEAERGLSRR